MRSLWRDRLACRLHGHVWVTQLSFGPGDVRNFSRCTRCGDIRDDAEIEAETEPADDAPATAD